MSDSGHNQQQQEAYGDQNTNSYKPSHQPKHQGEKGNNANNTPHDRDAELARSKHQPGSHKLPGPYIAASYNMAEYNRERQQERQRQIDAYTSSFHGTAAPPPGHPNAYYYAQQKKSGNSKK